jgi:hypothetical protein
MSMKIRLVLVTLGLLGLIAGTALLLSQARQTTWRFEAWPSTVLIRPCTSASLFLDQRLVLDQDLAGAAAVLTQAWREQGWEVEADIHTEGQSATLTARRGTQTFEGALTWENGTFHLVAKGAQRCPTERLG